MKRRWKETGLAALALLLLLVGTLLWLTFRVVKQRLDNQALIAAVKRNDTRSVVTLLNEGADANTQDEPKYNLDLWSILFPMLQGRRQQTSTATTALALAIGTQHRTLPPVYADVKETKNTEVLTVNAFPRENISLIRALLDHGAKVNVVIDGDTPLKAAIRQGKSATVLLLLQYKADIRLDTNYVNNVIVPVLNYRKSRVITEILDRFSLPELNSRTAYGTTLLMEAASLGNVEAVHALLDRHVDVNVRSLEGETALVLAEKADAQVKQRDKFSVIKMLKSAGAKE